MNLVYILDWIHKLLNVTKKSIVFYK